MKLYRYNTTCPRCGQKGETASVSPDPVMNCGACLFDDIEVVRLRLELKPDTGFDPDAVAGYHPDQSPEERRRRGG